MAYRIKLVHTPEHSSGSNIIFADDVAVFSEILFMRAPVYGSMEETKEIFL